MSTVRSIRELIEVEDPAWPSLCERFAAAVVPVEVLPVDMERACEVLYRLQVTAYSTLGALALPTGGLVVDHGWLRILGGGHGELPDLAAANEIGKPGGADTGKGSLTVAFDALGGQFAVNGGGLPGKVGEICFLGADTLRWEPIGAGHSAFIAWAVGGGAGDFYAGLRWSGWAEEVEELSPGEGLSIYPPLWSAEGRADIAGTSRRRCPLTELISLHLDMVDRMKI
ncbi:DUF2625 family protein [Nocardia jejuensis]|uniref:DUF2625 family protein n=1 Tax=Nocardia jejuensis TaxID=328049 RepID=UPI00082FF8D3|nr:DUF2625 family protein [Nocardia jejuensis]